MHCVRILLVSFLIIPHLSWAKQASCFPVPFDHFWFRVDKDTYKKMGKSTYFRDEQFSYYEPNKSPWGEHYGHYITGNLHYLEVFDEAMPTSPEPLGIGFLSEKAGCLPEIHARLNKIGKSFVMKPDAEWGRFTELEKNKTLSVWVSELKPAYVGASDGAIHRAAWLKRMKKMNGDTFEGQHNFQRIKEVIWRLNAMDAQLLGHILTALGWSNAGNLAYTFDGTKVVIEVTENLSATEGMKSLTLELLRPYKDAEAGSFRTIATDSPAQVTFSIK